LNLEGKVHFHSATLGSK